MSKQKSLTDPTPTPKTQSTNPKPTQPPKLPQNIELTKPKDMPDDTKIILEALEQIDEIIYATCQKIWQKYTIVDYSIEICSCGKRKKPDYPTCYDCYMKQKESQK